MQLLPHAAAAAWMTTAASSSVAFVGPLIFPILPPSPTSAVTVLPTTPATATLPVSASFVRSSSSSQSSLLQTSVSNWMAAAAVTPTAPPPSEQDIAVLQQAFAAVYKANGNNNNNANVDQLWTDAISLLTAALDRWQRQPADEIAGLLRTRADAHLQMGDGPRAQADYDAAVQLWQQSLLSKQPTNNIDNMDDSDQAAAELAAALLGRARTAKSMASSSSSNSNNPKGGSRVALAQQAAKDYQQALQLSSREDWDTDEERLQDGAARNPYAAWEWADALRVSRDFDRAAPAHALASAAFSAIGDRPRSVIALTDAGLDLAFAATATTKTTDTKMTEVESLLRTAIQKAPGVESRDVALLQRVMIKEGEGRMALAALLWNDGQRPEAETILGDACVRLDLLQAQMDNQSNKAKNTNNKMAMAPTSVTAAAGPETKSLSKKLLYSIDDDIRNVYGGLPSMSCSQFKNPQFLTDKLGWPEGMQQKVINLERLQ